jgi:hypothetical protein
MDNMLRRRFLLGRPLVRRPILGAALVGGLAYVVGRRGSGQAQASPTDDTRARLRDLDRLRTDGTISNDEYQARRAELIQAI